MTLIEMVAEYLREMGAAGLVNTGCLDCCCTTETVSLCNYAGRYSDCLVGRWGREADGQDPDRMYPLTAPSPIAVRERALELAFARQALGDLPEASRAEIVKMALKIVNKTLQHPRETLKRAAANGRYEEYARVVRELFGFEDSGGGGGGGGFETDGKENDFAIGVVAGEGDGIAGRVHDVYRSAAAALLLK